MSQVHLRHIVNALKQAFTGKIDMADYAGKSTKEVEDAFLSRSQAAYALVMLAGVEPDAAAKAVTDSFDDNGIDALLYHQDDTTLYAVQSKWHPKGNGSIQTGDMHKFAQGIRDLISGDLSHFNNKVKKRKSEIMAALDETGVRFQFIAVHTGVQHVAPAAKRPLQDLLTDLNDVSPIASSHYLTQKELHGAVAVEAEGAAIKLEVMLHDWGQCKNPYPSYYGQVEAEDVAKWWGTHGQMLFARNLRKFTGRTDVNEGISETLRKEPEKFWYYNNGITVLCNRLHKKPLGGSKRSGGVFVCEGVSVVNGAQTVGCIGEVFKTHQDKVGLARVSIRLISLSKASDEFATDITRAANTQNRIERRDFAALDPEQERLRSELWLDSRKSYVYKSGEPQPAPEKGCTIDEATISLACANEDVSLAVQAKREVGKLWEDVTKSPYRLLFNHSVTALRMWRCVEILRAVDAALKAEVGKRAGRDRMVAVHANRFILHHVFRLLPVGQFDDISLGFDSLKTEVGAHASVVLVQLTAIISRDHPSAYLNSLFKNQSKCRVLSEACAKAVAAATGVPATMTPNVPDEGSVGVPPGTAT